MDLLNNALFFLVAVAVLVSFHEFGHFIVARWLDVRVLKFSVGFGKTIWSWQKDRTATEYAIGAIPLGGYVRMLDEREGEVSAAERDQAFNCKPLSTRSLIVLAGPAANLVLAVLIYWSIGMMGTEDLKPVIGAVTSGSIAEQSGFVPGDKIVSVDNRPVRGWSEQRLYLLGRAATSGELSFIIDRPSVGLKTLRVALDQENDRDFNSAVLSSVIGIAPDMPVPEAKVAGLVESGPAERAGILKDDHILAIDSIAVTDWEDLVRKIGAGVGEKIILSVERDGRTITIPVIADFKSIEGTTIRRIGIYGPTSIDLSEYITRVRYGPLEAAVRGVETTWMMSSLTVRLFGKMLTGSASREHLSGPVSIARFAGQSASLGLTQFLAFLAVLSVSLGIINLLPIPVLDGGHLIYFAAEGVLGRPIPERVMLWGQQFGIVFIVLLMGLAFYNDFLSLLQ
jgi:regulator of sigma E protease